MEEGPTLVEESEARRGYIERRDGVRVDGSTGEKSRAGQRG
jgi:hypothetical protein